MYDHLCKRKSFFHNQASSSLDRKSSPRNNGMCSRRSFLQSQCRVQQKKLLRRYKVRGSPATLTAHRQEEEPEPMEGKKEKRVKAAAVCVLLAVLLSAQQLPAADAASAFCKCYVSCYSDCRLRHPRLFCKPLCGVVCALGGQIGGGCPGVCGEASGCVVDGEGESDAADADVAATCVEDCRKLRKAIHG